MNVVLMESGIESYPVNFVGKIAGSLVENGNVSRRYIGSTIGLLAPSGSWTESTQIGYNNLSNLDGGIAPYSNSNSGANAQNIFSFNLIDYMERKRGLNIGVTLADKVAWLRSNLKSIICNWWGFGSNKAGYRANVVPYVVASGWSTTPNTHINGVVSLVQRVVIATNAVIDDNGLVHFLAYAEAAGTVDNPTVAPTLSTSGSGSGLVAGTYYVKYAWVISGVGQTIASSEQNITITAGQKIVVTVPSLPFGISHAWIYISTTTNTETYQGSTTGITYTQTLALAAGAVPIGSNTAIVPSTINTDYVELIIK
jgi:hypothetical protein